MLPLMADVIPTPCLLLFTEIFSRDLLSRVGGVLVASTSEFEFPDKSGVVLCASFVSAFLFVSGDVDKLASFFADGFASSAFGAVDLGLTCSEELSVNTSSSASAVLIRLSQKSPDPTNKKRRKNKRYLLLRCSGI